MAKIIEVVSSLAVKVNVGDYQSVDFFTSAKSEVAPVGEDAEGVAAVTHKIVMDATLSKLRAHFRARGKKYDDATICRMYGLTQPKVVKDFP